MKKIAVIGGGISGLAFCHRLKENQSKNPNAPEWQLFESTHRLGGTIETEKRSGFLFEKGPDAFISEKPWALDLAGRLGLSDEIIGTQQENRQSYILSHGRLVPLPQGFYLVAPTDIRAFLKTPLFSFRGKARILAEMLVPRRTLKTDESVADFIRRRFGREMFERVGQAMIAGIYTGDAERLSIYSTMPRLPQLEKKYGSLILGLIKNGIASAKTSSGPRYSLFLSFRDGMQTLTSALEKKIGEKGVHLATPIEQVYFDAPTKRWVLEWRSGREHFDGLVLACSAKHAAKILKNCAANFSKLLNEAYYESVVTLNLCYDNRQFSKPPQGFGFVVPRIENSNLVACSFSSLKFAGRAPQGHTLLRAFAGGAFGRALFEKSGEAISDILRAEVEKILGIQGLPVAQSLARYTDAMAQYPVGHLQWLDRVLLEQCSWPGLYLTGSSYRGVGIPDCIYEAEKLADKLAVI